MGEKMDSGQGEGWVAPNDSAAAIKRQEIADKLKNGEDISVKELGETDAPKEDVSAQRRRELREQIEKGELTPNIDPPVNKNDSSKLPNGVSIDQFGNIHRE